jgi:hypothetical protein
MPINFSGNVTRRGRDATSAKISAAGVAAVFMFTVGCTQRTTGASMRAMKAEPASTMTKVTDAVAPGVIPVKVVKKGDGFELLRGGEPFFIKGAGGDDSKELLKECGGNSYRTWGASPKETGLDNAARLGLGVTVGIWLGHKEQGFNYKDPKQVADQLNIAREAVMRYRNSPALLIWGLGNEMEGYDQGDDPDVWRAVEGVAKMVKQLDPNHPTMTVVAEVNPDKIRALNYYCPDIDIVGINSYAGCASIAQRYKDAGGVKPYVITEYGPPGTWEMHDKTSWGAVPEPTSTQKADWYRSAYEKGIANQPLCLGSYAFAWGHKQEATATWYGMFLPDGSKLAAVDTLTELWTGKAPTFQAPAIKDFKVDGPDKVAPKSMVHVALDVTDPQSSPMKVDWVLQYDPASYHLGGGSEFTPPTFPDALINGDEHGADFKMPVNGGGYRVFAYIRNSHHEAAVGNVPLFVTGDAPPPALTAAKAKLPVVLYGDNKNGPWSPSGYEGNTGAIKMDDNCGENPHSGPTCLKVTYDAPDNWGGVVWQDPANDWGDQPGGLDLTGATKLTFWARGSKGGEVVSFSMGILGADRKFHDTAKAELKDVHLNTNWTQYTMDLSGQNMSQIKTGFVWVVAGQGAPVTFYLDDIKYE